MVLALSESDVSSVLDYRLLYEPIVASLRSWRDGRTQNGLRSTIRSTIGGLEVVSGIDGVSRYAGLKCYPLAPRGMSHTVLLFSLDTGSLDAVVDSSLLGAARTGILSAVATQHMAQRSADILGVIGSGFQAENQIRAIAANRRIAEVRIYSREDSHRSEAARRLAITTGLAVRAVTSAREACDGAGIVCTATTSRQPVLVGRDLDPHTHINAVGSRGLSRRELPEEVMIRSWVVVDGREQARTECGDILPLIETGKAQWALLPELADVVKGECVPEEGAQYSVFESLGLGVFDVVTAAHIVERAREGGVGREVDWSGPTRIEAH